LVWAIIFNASIGKSIANTFLMKYRHWYWLYFYKVLLTTLSASTRMTSTEYSHQMTQCTWLSMRITTVEQEPNDYESHWRKEYFNIGRSHPSHHTHNIRRSPHHVTLTAANCSTIHRTWRNYLHLHIVQKQSIISMGVDHGGTRGTSPPRNWSRGTLAQIVPLRFVSYRYKKERSVAFKIRQNPFSAGTLPRTRLRELTTLPRPPSRLERRHPHPTPPHSAPTHFRRSPCVPLRIPARSTPMIIRQTRL